MAIQKQEFYEGAALHRLASSGGLVSISYHPPFYVLNTHFWVYFKYSAKTRSPWGFSFTKGELQMLITKSAQNTGRIIVGLICGSDGIVTIGMGQFVQLGLTKPSGIHISCFRKHNEQYKVCGPDGDLTSKVSPSDWTSFLKGATSENGATLEVKLNANS